MLEQAQGQEGIVQANRLSLALEPRTLKSKMHLERESEGRVSLNPPFMTNTLCLQYT